MVLELKIPHGTSWEVIRPLLPKFFSYLLSFAFTAIYWGNHHHLLHTAQKVNAGVMWANAHLLFWLSLIPFATGWMGENEFERVTVATYGALLIICGIAYGLLTAAIRKTHKEETRLTKALSRGGLKAWISTMLYGASIPIALYVTPILAAALFVIVAVIWIVPSKAIEEALEHNEKGS